MGKGNMLALLAAVLLVCIGGYALLSRPASDAGGDEPAEEAITVAAIPAETVRELAWEYAARELVFQTDGTAWTCVSEQHFPMNQESTRFDRMLNALSEVTALRQLDLPGDPAEYGLEVPATVIRVTLEDGTAHTFTVGDRNALAGGYYMQYDGTDAVYLIAPELVEAFSCGLFDLVDTDEVPDLSGAVEYRLDKTVYHTETGTNGSTAWCQADGTPLDGEVSDRLTRALTAFTWAACIDFYADSDEVKSYEYNLEHGREVTVTCETVEGESVEYSFVIGNVYDEEHTIVSPADSDLVYTVRTSVTDALLLK